MPEWLKVLFVIIVLGGWLATVVATLMKGELPDATILGIPAALVIAVAPPFTIGRRQGTTDEAAPTTEAEQTP